MRALLILMSTLFFGQVSICQPGKVVSAYSHWLDKQLEEAKTDIEDAIKHPKTSDGAKTWLYRGKIYESIALDNTGKYSEKTKNEALITAVTSYRKVLTLNQKKIDKKDLHRRLDLSSNMALNNGVSSYNDKNFKLARDLFQACYDGQADLGKTDSLALVNIGLSNENLGDYKAAIETYQKCIEIGYKEVTMYSNIIYVYQRLDDLDNAEKWLKDGRTKYPDNLDFLFTQLNFDLGNGKVESAYALATKAIKMQPSNKTLYAVRGGLAEKLQKPEKEILADYNKAIELDPNYFEPTYNIGAYYYTKGSKLKMKANNLDLDEQDLYDKYQKEGSELYKKSLEYMEKAHAIDPTDLSALIALKDIYATLEMMDKLKETKDKIRKIQYGE